MFVWFVITNHCSEHDCFVRPRKKVERSCWPCAVQQARCHLDGSSIFPHNPWHWFICDLRMSRILWLHWSEIVINRVRPFAGWVAGSMDEIGNYLQCKVESRILRAKWRNRRCLIVPMHSVKKACEHVTVWLIRRGTAGKTPCLESSGNPRPLKNLDQRNVPCFLTRVQPRRWPVTTFGRRNWKSRSVFSYPSEKISGRDSSSKRLHPICDCFRASEGQNLTILKSQSSQFRGFWGKVIQNYKKEMDSVIRSGLKQ